MSTLIQIPGGGTFDPAIHEYRDDKKVIIPSVTQIGDSLGFFDFANVPGDTMEFKKKLGDAVHFSTHILDTGGDIDWNETRPYAKYIQAWEQAKEELSISVLESETPGIASINGMKFAFTRDKIVAMGRFEYRFVVELKCAYQEEAYWKYQLAFYDIGTVRMRPDEYLGRVAIQLKPDGTYKVYLYENPRDKDRCKYLLAAQYVKIEEGVKWQR